MQLVEDGSFQDSLARISDNVDLADGWTTSIFALTENRMNIRHGNITSYIIGANIIKASEVFDPNTFLPKEKHCLNAQNNSNSIAREGICFLAVPYDPSAGSLAFAAMPYNRTVVLEISAPSAAPFAALLSIVVITLLLSGLAALATIAWKRKRERMRATGTESEELRPVTLASLSEQQPCLPNSRHRPLTLESLVRKVSEGRFGVTDEYRKIEDLDQRFILCNQSMNEARKWNDRNNR